MALFSKSKGGPAEKQQLKKILDFIVDRTLNDNQFHSATVPANLAQKIEKLEPGLIELKTAVDAAGNLIAAATQKGIEAVLGAGAAATATQAQSTSEGKSNLYPIEKGYSLPPARRGFGAREDTYPFAQMNAVGDSFFVPASAERPNPAKALASTVSSATKRYAAVYPQGHERAGQPTGKDGRKFTVRARTVEDGEKTAGARVYRVA